MVVMIDTNVFVAALISTHEHHQSALHWFQAAEQNKVQLVLSAHSIAETYAVLTRLPLSPRISPTLARRMLDNALPLFKKIHTLEASDYIDMLPDLSDREIMGGTVYDAIIVKSAIKCKAKKLATFNRKHFFQLCDNHEFIITSYKESL